jgi:predicted acylesterase/phospholipase RssA
MGTLKMDTSAAVFRENTITNGTLSGDVKRNSFVFIPIMAFKIRKGTNNTVTQTTVKRLSFREKPNDIYRFNVVRDYGMMHFRSMNAQVSLCRSNKTAIRALYKRRLGNLTGHSGHVNTNRVTGIPYYQTL